MTTPVNVRLPKQPANAVLVGTFVGILVERFGGIAMEVFLWNRWGRHAFGINRKLRYREAYAINSIIGAIAAAGKNGIDVQERLRIERQRTLKGVSK